MYCNLSLSGGAFQFGDRSQILIFKAPTASLPLAFNWVIVFSVADEMM